MSRLRSLLVLSLLSGCFYVGGGARASWDVKSGEPTYSAQGSFGAFALQGQNDADLATVTDRHGFCFSLNMGAGFDQRLSRWEAVVGPRFGWLFPHGVAEFGFETRFGADETQLFGFMLSVGPRFELQGSYGDRGRSAHVISVPANAGFTVGDGFRPELGIGADYRLMSWSPGAQYH
jgi:hypothetical protein